MGREGEAGHPKITVRRPEALPPYVDCWQARVPRLRGLRRGGAVRRLKSGRSAGG